MSGAESALPEGRANALRLVSLPVWKPGLAAAATWSLAAIVTVGAPDLVAWNDTRAFAGVLAGAAAILVATAFLKPILGRSVGRALDHNGPWLIALGLIFAVWEAVTAKLGWFPKPFFAPPQGLFHVYLADGDRLLTCVLYSLRLWASGFAAGVAVGFTLGVGLGWSKWFGYWGMPVLKLIGPVPATAWLPFTFFIFPTTFSGGAFLVALASGIPVAILTASGIESVDRVYYDAARTLGANTRFLISRVAIPAALPHVFVGLFMGLYYSFAVLVVAEMLGAKYGLGWYLQFQTGYSAYANVYAALAIMALLCSGVVKLLFVGRARLLVWRKGIL